jgi:hypothetical protein
MPSKAFFGFLLSSNKGNYWLGMCSYCNVVHIVVGSQPYCSVSQNVCCESSKLRKFKNLL